MKKIHYYSPHKKRIEHSRKREERLLECDHCDMKLHPSQKYKIERHLMSKHFPWLGTEVLFKRKDFMKNTFKSLRIVNENGQLKCRTCNSVFSSREYALKHSKCKNERSTMEI